MDTNLFNIKGLTPQQVMDARKKFGLNALDYKQENNWLNALKNLAKEPMNLLLLATATIYFVSGKTSDALFLTAALVFISMISLYQDSRSRNALAALKKFTQQHSKVIRNGKLESINSEDLVVGDSLMVEEGTLITADAHIIHSNDFTVNESILTGESFTVAKTIDSTDHSIYSGTSVATGLAIATVTAIGNATQLGKIGDSLESIPESQTPLEYQIRLFVQKMALAGAIVFFMVWAINYWRSSSVLSSLLQALTLAMSIIPEEIPIAFTTFMAIGAGRLMKMGIMVKQMKTVETLGSATVICTDKTGTLTENKMSLAKVFVLSTQKITDLNNVLSFDDKALIQLAMWASESIPFDPMEKALHAVYAKTMLHDERLVYKMVREYALGGKPPMMTHVFEHADHRIIAAKGAPEAIIAVSNLTAVEKQQIEKAMIELTKEGYRVLGVGEGVWGGQDFPTHQETIPFIFKGIVAFYDPPKPNIQTVLEGFYQAGIAVKIVTGDNTETTTAIAQQVGFRGYDKSITGDELMALSEADLKIQVIENQVFTRMFPEAKLKIINALKANNEIVAMTGDGVNDGPALKAAHIGVAMGKKGTEIAKQAASLILLDDDLSKMLEAVASGRKIYTNLKKAIQYVITTHIPIIAMVFIPLALDWVYPNLFAPIHIIFLELIMGPTCSIIYENEPMEKNAMTQKPRPFTDTFFSWKELMMSLLQGLMIALGGVFVYQYAVYQGFNEAITRTMVFTMLIASNLMLTLVNRSFYYSIFTTLGYKNNLVWMIIVITIVLHSLLLFVKPLTQFFELERLNFTQLSISIGIGLIYVLWFEGAKWRKRMV
jgi:P-type Ca2+ transporter type 2C